MNFFKIATLSIAMLGQCALAQTNAPPSVETPAAVVETSHGAPKPGASAAETAPHGQPGDHTGAADHGAEEHKGVSAKASGIFGLKYFTNSLLMALIVAGIILWFVRSGMRKATMVPGKKQNVVEFLVEFLYKQVENIVGPKVAPRAFPLLGTIFIFTLVSNYFGLLPGVGTIGFSKHVGPGLSASHLESTLLRPPTADMNFTIGMALSAMLIWFILTLQEQGLWGFIVHTFGPKGGLKGMMRNLLVPIFVFVGAVEIISIVFRPVSLSFRLFGNIFAGESLLHTMSGLIKGNAFVEFFFSVLLPIPFYFLEVLVGLLQAMVFSLLCAVYIQLSTSHEGEHGEEHH
jgi:F-type H+-transporting ATPase subunit a